MLGESLKGEEGRKRIKKIANDVGSSLGRVKTVRQSRDPFFVTDQEGEGNDTWGTLDSYFKTFNSFASFFRENLENQCFLKMTKATSHNSYI